MPLTPEQQDLRKDALTLKRLFPAYRPEHTVAEGFLALLAQLEEQEAPGEPEFSHDPDGELCMEWYVGDSTLSVSIGGVGRVSWAMLAGDKKASGARLFANERSAPAQPGYSPKFDEAEFDAMVEKGTKAWAGVPDNWLEVVRGNEPDSAISQPVQAVPDERKE